MGCYSRNISTLILGSILATSSAYAEKSWFESLTEASTDTTQQTQDITSSLTQQAVKSLGLSQEQAEYGLGGLFQVAKHNLDAQQFNEISNVVPDLDQLIKLVPGISEEGGFLNSFLSQAGDTGKALQSANYIKDLFAEHGISLEKLVPLTQLVIDYLNTEGGAQLAGLFKQAVTGIEPQQ